MSRASLTMMNNYIVFLEHRWMLMSAWMEMVGVKSIHRDIDHLDAK
jgi:hypothetical protein